ncbi:hypothetical protein [Heyndrickxia acidicola]|uniref:Uncharacterized protein n=1 Tax=Heyndrickxia acidicola TaxID=209389 RepID=A0ABU6MGZ9_9BACI|nr:hypothetical protein [Heyndrickxia acidicola]MED1202320.1 hypothetical protein [Heyndrickxia acidicola]
MGEEHGELKSWIRRFYDLLEKYPDRSKNAAEFLSFLRDFLKISIKDPLPIVEIMTIIKEYKPTVFFTLKKMANKNMMLQILTESSMESRVANNRLKMLVQ